VLPRAKVTIDSIYEVGRIYEESIDTKMLCLEVILGHVNHCITFAIEYLGNHYRQRLDFKGHRWEMACGESNGHVIDDVTWPERSSRDPNTLGDQYLENSWRCYL